MEEKKRTEWEKMVACEAYRADDPELEEIRRKCRDILDRLNRRTDRMDSPEQRTLIAELLGLPEERKDILIQPPFYCDYGLNIKIGKNFMTNFNCVILDCAEVIIGDNVMMGPGVQIFTAYHPTDPILRYAGQEFAETIRIGNNVWIGGGSIVLPGVTIGDNVVIGGGSVVTKDIPADSIAVGSPCRVLRKLDPTEYGKEMFI